MVGKITSLKAFLNIMEDAPKKDYTALAKRLEIPIEGYRPYMFWDKESYTRNCIVRTEQYELILLCWEPGQETPIHCHGGEECWVKIVKGTIKENRYHDDEDSEEPIKKATIIQKAPGLSYMNDDMGFHSLHNQSDGRALSLHLYMNPIDECRIFDEDEGVFEKKSLQYTSYEGELLVAQN